MHPGDDKATTGHTAKRLLTVAEAAEELGLTVEAVRSRIKRGTLEKEKAPDGSVFVVVNTARARPVTDHERQGEGQGDDWATAQALMITRLENEVEFLRSQLERKDHLLAAALERIPAIEAPPDTPSESTPRDVSPEPRDSPVTASEEQEKGTGREDNPGQGRRSWWQLLFGGR